MEIKKEKEYEELVMDPKSFNSPYLSTNFKSIIRINLDFMVFILEIIFQKN